MQFMDQLEEQIDKMAKNKLGIEVNKNFSRGVLSAEIIIPKKILKNEISNEDIKFLIFIDSFSLSLYPIPKLYCLTPYCFPHLADGRDLFKELSNVRDAEKDELLLDHLLEDILEFIKINFERGGLIFCGEYYLEEKYDVNLFNNKCKKILVKQCLNINGKIVKFNRTLILSDVHFLLFGKDKSNKNNLVLLFWASFNNIEKIQKLKDNKTVMLHWATKDKDNCYLMNLIFTKREEFLKDLLERVKTFGMNFDVYKLNNMNEVEHEKFTSDFQLKKIKENEKEQKDENKDEKKEEEEEDDDEKDNNDDNKKNKIENDISTKEGSEKKEEEKKEEEEEKEEEKEDKEKKEDKKEENGLDINANINN